MAEEQVAKLVWCHVSGVTETDRNFFAGMCQRRLLEEENFDLRVDWSGGQDGTKNVRVTVDCSEFDFSRIRIGMQRALAGTYLSEFTVAPKNDLSRVAA